MIVERHAPEDLFALVPKLVSDFELVLRELDRTRFGTGTTPDAVALARRAVELEPRLLPVAA